MRPTYSIDEINLGLVYQEILQDLRFLKSQQWRVTNYTVLLFAALFGLYKGYSHITKYLGVAAALIIVISIFTTITLECAIQDVRHRKRRLKSLLDQDALNLLFSERGSKVSEYFVVTILIIVQVAGFIVISIIVSRFDLKEVKVMEIAVIWLGLSILAGYIAARKGRSGIGFFFLSVLLSPIIGIIAALVVGSKNEIVEQKELETGSMKRCPYCAELIKKEAIKCKHCGSDLVENTSASISPDN